MRGVTATIRQAKACENGWYSVAITPRAIIRTGVLFVAKPEIFEKNGKRRIDMQQKLDALRAEILAQMDEAKTGRGLYELKLKFQAELKTVMSGM
ncbi:MAG: hypothetical protein IJX18_01810, partial [Clostridia bacterium]|nr:hypothetical protein [Clostridia bacterium]